ncbi:MAG TPA: glycerate kinase, partial [Solirubrobacteraceae bacterium]
MVRTGIPTTILVAPDSFKGTFSALEVTAAIARGLEGRGRPVDPCPVADGGEGTLQVLVGALGGELVDAQVEDPLGRGIEATFALLDGGARAVVETAAASGLGLVAEPEREPLAASTRGT